MSSAAHPLRILMALMVGFVLLPPTGIGIVGAIYDEGPLRPVFAMMGVVGVLGVGSTFHTVYTGLREGRVERERVRDARAGDPAGEVVARWRIDRSEGRAFAEKEWAARKRQVVGGAFGVFATGWIFLAVTQKDPVGGLWGATFLAALYVVIGLAKYGMEYRSAVGPEGDDVIVMPDAVFVGGTWHALSGGPMKRELLGVSLDGDALVFRVQWETREGPAGDAIRAPVPADRRADAERVVAHFARA